MGTHIYEMFSVIATQLFKRDHPLNVIARHFVGSFVEYYSKLIRIDDTQPETRQEKNKDDTESRLEPYTKGDARAP